MKSSESDAGALLRIGLLTSIGRTIDAFFPSMIRHWRSQGHVVLCASGPPSSHEPSTSIRSITRRPSAVNLVAPLAIRRWARVNALDVVIVNTATASALARVGKMPCPVIYFCHGLHWNTQSKLAVAAKIEQSLLRNTAGVIVINSDDERWFREQGKSALPLLRLIGGVGVNLNEYLPTRVSRTPGQLCWVGEMADRKRPEDAVKLSSELTSLGVPHHLYMLGEGKLQDRVSAMAAKDDGAQVTLLGFTNPIPWMRTSQVVVHTARWEGLPRVLLEAVALETSVCAYDVKGTRDVPSITLSPDGEVKLLAQKVAALLGQGTPASESTRSQLSDIAAADHISEFARTVVLANRSKG